LCSLFSLLFVLSCNSIALSPFLQLHRSSSTTQTERDRDRKRERERERFSEPRFVLAMGDVLMLKGAPSPWSSGLLDNPDIDALPYIDHDYADPTVKAEVDKLIEEEIRRSSKRPADFLAQLPPVPKLDFTVWPLPSPPPFCF
jgi:hypothetical protein